MFCGPKHVEESVRCVGLLSRKSDPMLFAAINDILCVFVGEFHEILLMFFHLLSSLLGLMDHFVNLNSKRITGT